MKKKVITLLMYCTCMLCCCMCLCTQAISQTTTITIHGEVRSISGEALSQATVKVSGARRATATDSGGVYTIIAPANGSLEFSFVGYLTKTLKINGQTSLNASLEIDPASGNLNNVVVVGYGRQKAPTVTGAIATVSGRDLTKSPVSNITNMLVGRASGISSIQGSGEPGQNAATIRIRGISTLNGQDPLIVIDGIQQPAENPYVVLNSMDANEIENISILKDASATAVYGIRGANGVIIVTTKRGSKSKPQFSFSANEGFSKATTLLNTINSYEFASFRNEAIYNAQAFGNHSFDKYLFTDDEIWKFQNNRDYTPEEVAAMTSLTSDQQKQLNNSPALYYTSHNYYKEQFSGTGKQQQYNLNISGGSNRVRYFTSLGYYHQQGILNNTSYAGANTNSDFKRYNFRSNFDIDVIRNFQISINLAGQSSDAVGPVAGYSASDLGNRYQNISQTILESSPFAGPGIVDGKLITGALGTAGDATNPLGLKGGGGYSPLAQLLTASVLQQYTTTLTSSVTLKHSMAYITKGLNAHATVSYDDSYMKGFSRTNSIPTYSAYRDPSNPNNFVFIGGQINPVSTTDNVSNATATWRKVYLEAAVDYNRTFGKHNVSGLVLGNAQKYTANGMSFNTPSGLMGLVGRVTYNYSERYLLEFNMGLNGTENFAPGKRFGYFPAVSAGWVLSKEPFFPKNNIVTWVKFRGSYGEVGNDQLGSRRYLYLPSSWTSGLDISSGNPTYGYWFGNTNGSSNNPYYTGAVETSIGNPDITWERAKKTNLSADLRFLRDRLTVTTTYFKENRDKILVTLQTIPSTYGVPSGNVPPANVGKVSNKGYEVEAGWSEVIGKVSYFIKGNFSYARNKIEYMAEPPYPYPWMNATGYSIGQYKGLISDGFYNTTKDLNNRPYNTYGNFAKLGDIKYKDINGDGIIDNKDIVPIGYPNVPEIAYNLSIGFSYKGFDISALIIGTAKGSFPQSGYILSTPFAKNVGEVLQYAYDGHWTPEKYAAGEKITYPEFSFDGSGPNNLFSDFWLKSNDFQRLKNLEVGYNFQNAGFMKRANINGIRVYVNGANLITWGSKLIDGVDPELADYGKASQGYIYPLTKTINFGANIQF